MTVNRPYMYMYMTSHPTKEMLNSNQTVLHDHVHAHMYVQCTLYTCTCMFTSGGCLDMFVCVCTCILNIINSVILRSLYNKYSK